MLERIVDLLGASPDDADGRLSALLELTELVPGAFRHQKVVERLLVRRARH